MTSSLNSRGIAIRVGIVAVILNWFRVRLSVSKEKMLIAVDQRRASKVTKLLPGDQRCLTHINNAVPVHSIPRSVLQVVLIASKDGLRLLRRISIRH